MPKASIPVSDVRLSGAQEVRGAHPLHRSVIENMKDQLLIVLMQRLGGKADIPVTEIDATGGNDLLMSLDKEGVFHFSVRSR